MSEQRRRPLFRSVPLRAGKIAQQVQTQDRDSRNTTNGYVQTRKPVYTTNHQSMPVEDGDFSQDYLPVKQVTPRSAIRYIGTDKQGRDILQQGNKRLVVEHARRHWLLPAGLGMLAMVALMAGIVWFGNWYDNHQLYATYGYPRTWQTDQNVGHGTGESHFIFENLNGHVFFLEIDGGYDFKHSTIYPVMVLHGDNAASYPVTATFQDVNGDGRIDMLIKVGSQIDVFLNTPSGWKPEQ